MYSYVRRFNQMLSWDVLSCTNFVFYSQRTRTDQWQHILRNFQHLMKLLIFELKICGVAETVINL